MPRCSRDLFDTANWFCRIRKTDGQIPKWLKIIFDGRDLALQEVRSY
jgi:hypothetical protein